MARADKQASEAWTHEHEVMASAWVVGGASTQQGRHPQTAPTGSPPETFWFRRSDKHCSAGNRLLNHGRKDLPPTLQIRHCGHHFPQLPFLLNPDAEFLQQTVHTRGAILRPRECGRLVPHTCFCPDENECLPH